MRMQVQCIFYTAKNNEIKRHSIVIENIKQELELYDFPFHVGKTANGTIPVIT